MANKKLSANSGNLVLGGVVEFESTPALSGGGEVVDTVSAQSIGGAKTFTGAVAVDSTLGIGLTTVSSGLVEMDISGANAQLNIANQTSKTLAFGDISADIPAISGKTTGADTTGLSLEAATTDTNTTEPDMYFRIRENDNTDFTTLNTPGFKFRRFATDLMTILRNGNVGIGTPSPSSLLDIVGSGDISMEMNSSSSNRVGQVFQHAGSQSFAVGVFTGSWNIYGNAFSSAQNFLRVDSTGVVTLGPSKTFNYEGQRHKISGGIWAANVSSSSQSGIIVLGTNAKVSSSANYGLGREQTAPGGAALIFDNNTSATNNAFRFMANLPGDATSTLATQIGAATFQGAWTLGPSGSTSTSLRYVFNIPDALSLNYTTTPQVQICSGSGSNTPVIGMFTSGTAAANYNIIGSYIDDSTTPTYVMRFDVRQNDGTAFSSRPSTDVAWAWTDTGVERMLLTHAGALSTSTGSLGTISDAALKNTIENLDKGLDEVLALQPRKWQWNEPENHAESPTYGFVAQEAETVIPEMVTKVGKFKNVQCGTATTAILVKAIQELNAKLEAAEAEIEALKGN